MTPPLPWSWLGRQPYAPVHERQLQLRRAILAGHGEPTLLLVEHEPVVTLGRRGSDADLALSRGALRDGGVDVVSVERGGLATYHGPGQLVGYPVIPLASFGLTVPAFVHRLEAALIEFVGGLGVVGHRREGWPGVWVGRTKIAAIGLHIHRGVSIHGFALNLTLRPAVYGCIVPCGIPAELGSVSSVAELAGAAPEPGDAASEVARIVVRTLVE